MTTRYPLATTSPGAKPAAASARLPRSARHQLWHLSSPLLLLLDSLAAPGPIRAQQTFAANPFAGASPVSRRG